MAINMRLKDKFGSSRLENLIAALCGKKSLTEQQVDKLYQLIEELKEEDND